MSKASNNPQLSRNENIHLPDPENTDEWLRNVLCFMLA